MNHIELKDPTQLKTVFQAINTLMDDTNVSIDEQGVILRGMNSSNTTLTDVFIPKDCFVEFHFDKEYNFSLDVGQIVKILSRSKPSDIMRLEVDPRGLNIIIQGEYKKTYNLGVKVFNENHNKLPKVAFMTTLEATPQVLKDIVDDLQLVSNRISLNVKGNILTIDGKDDSKTKGSLIEFMDKKGIDLIKSDGDFKAIYSFDMFDRLVGVMKGSSDKVTIDLGNKQPMRLQYIMPGFCTLHTYVAPFLSDD